MFVSKQQLGDFKAEYERRHGQLEGKVELALKAASWNRNLLIMIAGGIAIEIILEIGHYFFH
jgi:hypothetical protein